MIICNDKPLTYNKFPDKTLAIRVEPDYKAEYQVIEWRYECEEEMAILYYVTRHLKSFGVDIVLHLPYIPNARMDRVKNPDEIFTLQYFAEFVNSLGYKAVFTRDPHSNVACALIKNLRVDNCFSYIINTITDIADKNLVMYYPDEGAMKRYSSLIKDKPYAFGLKERDWRSGDIKGIKVINEDFVKGKNILIVDDICSKGGTFYHSAKALKSAGAKDIYLYVTHCENTIFKGELIESDLIKHIYTTRSIYTLADDKITVLE